MGGVRTALYNYLYAKQKGGDFIIRIEDTDSHRFVPGAEQYIIESLRWCGIIPDEGVDENGNVVASDLYTYDGVLKAGKDLWWPGSVHPVLQGLNPGNYTYRCTLDDDHAICETSEGNNVATYDFVVTTMTAMQFYVDASGGSDANDGSSVGKAFASIQKAVDGASDGDTIWVNDGVRMTMVDKDHIPEGFKRGWIRTKKVKS